MGALRHYGMRTDGDGAERVKPHAVAYYTVVGQDQIPGAIDHCTRIDQDVGADSGAKQPQRSTVPSVEDPGDPAESHPIKTEPGHAHDSLGNTVRVGKPAAILQYDRGVLVDHELRSEERHLANRIGGLQKKWLIRLSSGFAMSGRAEVAADDLSQRDLDQPQAFVGK